MSLTITVASPALLWLVACDPAIEIEPEDTDTVVEPGDDRAIEAETPKGGTGVAPPDEREDVPVDAMPPDETVDEMPIDDEPEVPTDETTPPRPTPRPTEAQPCDGYYAESIACTTDAGQPGESYCILVDGEELETPCVEYPDCIPGDGYDQGCMGSICTWNGESLEYFSWSEPNCNTPLVLNFETGPVTFAPASAVAFDLSPNGTCLSTDWPSAPWLALDRDGDGMIAHGGELFGDATPVAAGGFAAHGFAALAELDSNRDGLITAADARFGELVLWTDLDDDRLGAHDELQPLATSGVVSIDLGFATHPQCDARGNCGYERASFSFRTAEGITEGEVVDVHLACR